MGKNGFIIANAATEWENEVKYAIMKAVTTSIQQKDNEHALAPREMNTANKRELKKILQALATLSKRVDGIATREGNKGGSRDNKSGGVISNRDRGSGGSNHNPSGKNDNKENNANGVNKKWIYTTGMDYDTTWPYNKRKWFNK